MLKQYTVKNYLNLWECVVEINEEFIIQKLSEPDRPYTTLMAMKEMILFWMGGKDLLENNEQDVTKSFLKQLAREIFIILSSDNLNEIGVIAEFENREGWFSMDGSCGIKITYVEDVEISYSDFAVEDGI